MKNHFFQIKSIAFTSLNNNIATNAKFAIRLTTNFKRFHDWLQMHYNFNFTAFKGKFWASNNCYIF